MKFIFAEELFDPGVNFLVLCMGCAFQSMTASGF